MSTLPTPQHAAPSPAGGQSPHSRATHAWSAGSTLGPVHPPGVRGEGIKGQWFRWKMRWKQSDDRGNNKPPSSRLLTFQTGNDRAGKATPLYAARRPHRQSTPGEAVPSPRMPEDTRHTFIQKDNYLLLYV